jgi:D-3-phosphoglycerate dehydrogenase
MKKKLYIKVCGNSKEENILAVKNTEPDLMGFIFPKDTPRHPLLRELRDTIHEIPERTRKVGVFENEPINLDNALLKNRNVLLSPHTAALTNECKIRMGNETAQNIIDFFEKKINKNMLVNL